MNLEQVERIRRMESILSRAEFALEELHEALDRYEAMEKELDALGEYYEGALWRKDFEDDSGGELPEDLQRGVLSEDGIWNVLAERSSLISRMKKAGEDNNSGDRA